jgi:hypothetical protein
MTLGTRDFAIPAVASQHNASEGHLSHPSLLEPAAR